MNKTTMAAVSAIIIAAVLMMTVAPASDAADGDGTETTLDFGGFLKAVEDSNYNYNPTQTVTVQWSPTTACTGGANHTCLFTGGDKPPADGNNAQRIQSSNAQYQIFSNADSITISNVKFVFVPAYFTICTGNAWGGTASKDKIVNAELQFLNSGDLTIRNCEFNQVIVSPYGLGNNGTTSVSTTIEYCKFNDVANTYAIKDVYSTNATITGCDFDGCSGGIYFEGTREKGQYTISNNTFTDMDANTSANRENSRGLIQFSAQGDYSESTISITGNDCDADTSVLLQLNPTVTEKIDSEKIQEDNTFSGDLFVGNMIYLDPENGDDTNGGVSETYPVKTFQKALSIVAENGTIVLMNDMSSNSTIAVDRDVTFTLNLAGNDIVVNGSVAIRVQNGDLTIIDSTATMSMDETTWTVTYSGGRIESTTHAIQVEGSTGASLTLVSGMIESTGNCGVYVLGNQTPGGNGAAYDNSFTMDGGYIHAREFGAAVAGIGATFTFNDGYIVTVDNAAIAGNGTNDTERYDGGTVININGGTAVSNITSSGYISCGVYHPQSGTLNITGGKIVSTSGIGILMRGGEYSMTDGEVIALGTGEGKVGDSKIITSGSGIFVDMDSAYYDNDNIDVGVKGGTVSSDGDAIKFLDSVGGEDPKDYIQVTGGTFSSDVSGFLADGFQYGDDGKVVFDSASYEVVVYDADGYVVGGFETLEEAVAAATAGQRIELQADVELDKMLDIKVDGITLDLNGKKIAASENYNSTFENDSFLINVGNDGAPIENVTIMDGTIVGTAKNKHPVNIYDSDGIVLRDLTIDATDIPKGAPLVVAGSSVTLGGEMTFIGGPWGYSVNLGIGSQSDKTSTSVSTKAGTSLHFNGVAVGFYADQGADKTAKLTFGEGTEYDYDRSSFELYDAAETSTLTTPGETPIDRVQNPLYSVTINVTPADAEIVVEGYDGTVTSGTAFEIEKGDYKVTITKEGYTQIVETISVPADGESFTFTMKSTDVDPTPGGDDDPVSPPAGGDDDEDLPPIIRPGGSGSSSSDDDTVTIVACAAAAAVAAILAVFLIYAYRKD